MLGRQPGLSSLGDRTVSAPPSPPPASSAGIPAGPLVQRSESCSHPWPPGGRRLAIAFAAWDHPQLFRSVVLRSNRVANSLQQGGPVGAWRPVLLVCLTRDWLCDLVSGFRGGPIFPSMFIGAAGGIVCPRWRVADDRRRGHGGSGNGRRGLRMPMTAVLFSRACSSLRCRRPHAGRDRRGCGVVLSSLSGSSRLRPWTTRRRDRPPRPWQRRADPTPTTCRA